MHLLQSGHFSGAENVVCQIFSMFENDSDTECVYCSHDGSIRLALEERNIPFYPLCEFSLSSVKKAIRDIKPDIIHAHDMNASFLASLVCGNIKLISHIHNNSFDSRGLSLKSIAYLYAGFKAKHIFWVSSFAFEGYAFHKLLKNKSEVLYNIIDTEKLIEKAETDTNSYDYDCIFLGRLTEPKNPLRLMDVCKLLTEKKPDIKIAIVGRGEMEKEAKKKAEQLGIMSNVSFLGYMQNPAKILKDSKVMLMTSLWEGTPICALEAAALGIPIVSTPVDGLKELIENGKNGFLSDDNEELASVIIDLLVDEEKLKKFSENQMIFAKKWNDKKKYYSAVKHAYEEVRKK